MPRVSLQSRLPAISASLRPRVSAAVKEVAEAVADEARARVHVDTGNLRESISVDRVEAAGYAISTPDPAGLMEEFGTVNQPAHPWLIPSLESNTENAERLVAAALKRL